MNFREKAEFLFDNIVEKCKPGVRDAATIFIEQALQEAYEKGLKEAAEIARNEMSGDYRDRGSDIGIELILEAIESKLKGEK